MHHLNWKSLAFYGIAIGSVVILFNVVSAYGETQLKAPTNIGGTYRIDVKNLPQCLNSDELTLTIEQSGVYLFGSLSSIPLNGKLSQQQISLYGESDLSGDDCQNIEIQGQKQENNLAGKIIFNSNTVDFIAKLQESQQESEAEH